MSKHTEERIVKYLKAVKKAADTWIGEFRYQPEMQKGYYWTLLSEVYLAQIQNRPLLDREAYAVIGMSPSTGGRALDTAVGAGYISIEPHQSVKVVKLTKKGENVLKQACNDALDALDIMYSIVDPSESQQPQLKPNSIKMQSL